MKLIKDFCSGCTISHFQQWNMRFPFPISSPAVDSICFLDDCPLTGVKWNPSVILICTSILAEDVGHFSTYLQSMCDSVESPRKWNPQAHFLDVTTSNAKVNHNWVIVQVTAKGWKAHAALGCILLRRSRGETVSQSSTLKVSWIKVW
jgi:hypothetical protein